MDIKTWTNILDNGVTVVIIAMALLFVYHYFTKLDPRLTNLESEAKKKNYLVDELAKIAVGSTEAIKQVAKSSDNVAHSIELLSVSMETTTELMKMMRDDNREILISSYQQDDKIDRLDKKLEVIYEKMKEGGK